SAPAPLLQRSRRPKTAERPPWIPLRSPRSRALQRSRRPKTAESLRSRSSRRRRRPCFNGAAVRRRRRGHPGASERGCRRVASTEPPSEDGGELGAGLGVDERSDASTEPPSEDGGEAAGGRCAAAPTCALQRSRRPKTAESRWAVGQHRRADVASTEPPSEDGGERVGGTTALPTSRALQRSRRPKTAERCSLSRSRRAPAHRFNGAAVRRRRSAF